jgi:LAGLIDADG DNA endonuclease family
MLGDVSLQSQDNQKTYRLKFEGGNRNREYIQHLRDEFDAWCLSDITPKTRIHPKTGTLTTNWCFQTISHADFKYFASLFLNENGKKTVPKGLVKEANFTAKSLAYWIMDDGGKMDYGPNEGNGTILHTQAFSEEEVGYLCEGLQDKFDLQCWSKKDKSYYCLAISGKSYEPLMEIIDEHIIPSMRHKLPSPRRKKS